MDRGWLETRRYWQSAAPDWFAKRAKWAKWEGLRSVGVVEAVWLVGGKPATVERHYYLSSLGLTRAVRGHGSVENQCH